MNRSKKILIVDSNKEDQHLIALLFKRSIYGLDNASLSVTYAASFTEAQNCLSQEQFDIITLDGEFPCFVDVRLGHNLIHYVREYQNQLPVIIMITDECPYLEQGIQKGANHGFTKKDIRCEVKLNEKFELVPLQQLSPSA